MKKYLRILLPAATVILIVLLTVIFWDPILDALPIDQSGWKERSGNLYYLDENGDPLTGWQELDGSRYYLGSDGIARAGWQEIDGKTYYLSDTGAMHTGWLQNSGKDYYLLPDGALASGWQEVDRKSYYFNSDGTPYSGWLTDNGTKHYLLTDGMAASGWQEIEGSRYFFDSKGIPLSGWLTTSEGQYYLREDGAMATGWTQTEEGPCYFDENGIPLTGWQELDGSRYYLAENGLAATGWAEIDSRRYYFDESGAAVTGWLEKDGSKYYLTENGAARGKLVIDDTTYYFTSTGANIVLVNPWNYLPDGYTVDLVDIPGGRIDRSCYDALMAMLEACRADGYSPVIVSSYRTQNDQSSLHRNMINSYIADGYGYNAAYAAASQIVAVPGTSEHQMGLALDIVDTNYRKLDHGQSSTATQKWLMEHCWEYGFILRYPDGTTELTGIIYEPWHYRYVGLELALEMKELGICLEEYLDNLTAE